jgi:hypothetical protein
VHHHLVDDHLRAERRGECDQLDEERSGENVAPHRPVAQQLRPEPAEAEARSGRGAVGALGACGRFVAHEDHFGLEQRFELGEGSGFRVLLARLKVEEPAAVRLDQYRGLRSGALEESDAGLAQRLQLAVPEPEFACP